MFKKYLGGTWKMDNIFRLVCISIYPAISNVYSEFNYLQVLSWQHKQEHAASYRLSSHQAQWIGWLFLKW